MLPLCKGGYSKNMPIKISLLWISLFILTYVKVCKTNQYCVQTTCQARTAIISGFASVVDIIAEDKFDIGLKKGSGSNLDTVGFFDKSEPDFCSSFCSTDTTEKDFDQIDEFISKSTLEMEELVKKHQKTINNIMKDEQQLYGFIRISYRQHAADSLKNEVEEKLRLLDWFAQLDATIKQKLLVKYALLRMYQSNVLKDLKELHIINDNLRTSISFGSNNEPREAEKDLNHFWNQFESLKKDELGGLNNGQLSNEFENFSEKIASAVSKIAEPSLSETKGFCHSSTLAFFQGVFTQSLFLRSILLKLKGHQLLMKEYQEWSSSLSDIENNYKSACLSK